MRKACISTGRDEMQAVNKRVIRRLDGYIDPIGGSDKRDIKPHLL